MLGALKIKNSYYLVLVFVFIFHFVFMMSKYDFSLEKINTSSTQKIHLKLQHDKSLSFDQQIKKQIVQSQDTENQTEPKKKSFLSDKNRTFDRETVARNIDKFNDSSSRGELGEDQIVKKSKKTNQKNLKLSDLSLHPSQEREMNQIVDKEFLKKGSRDGTDLKKGVSSNNDYVEEVQLGDFTQLNTVEYKHYGFFHRIRQKLEQFWGRSIREKADNLYRSGRRLPASDNLITSLQVTLNEKGEIVQVKIMSTSGVRDLDDAAIESFNQAGPFPNPPKDLLVNGKATIEWGFVVKS